MRNWFLLSVTFVLGFCSFAGNPTQNIRGVVVDKRTGSPVPGATVLYMQDGTTDGVNADGDGRFVIEDVEIGIVHVEVSFIGYNPVFLQNLQLNSGKELVLNVQLDENINQLEAVSIVAEAEKAGNENTLAKASSRTLSLTEGSKYAGSMNDPSKMVQSFAGVGGTGDQRNDIIIRGNSPVSMLWRIEGLNSPNPNHFGAMGATGGPVPILNSNMLDRSDFITGAFPAEYGNATAGVFDVRIRKGNDSKNECYLQVASTGLEIGSEGPLPMEDASYMASYRYSTLGVSDKLGLDFGYGSIPQYQDLTFKVNLPLGAQYGELSFFGVGGLSHIDLLHSGVESGDFNVRFGAQDVYYESDMGITGLHHKYFFNDYTRSDFRVALSGMRNGVRIDSTYAVNEATRVKYGNSTVEQNISLNWQINKKLNAKNHVRWGAIYDVKNVSYHDSIRLLDGSIQSLRNMDGRNHLFQMHAQYQYRFSNTLEATAGLHYQQMMENGDIALEPRAAISWQMFPKHKVSYATGWHSQMQPLFVYYTEMKNEMGTVEYPNDSLGFSKSMHHVMTYDFNMSNNWRLKADFYYQKLSNIAVTDSASHISGANFGAAFEVPGALTYVNEGEGQNIGAELTIEKFFSDHYYLLATGAVYDSKYLGSDGEWRNTAFNGQYMLSFLGGVDLPIDANERHAILFNVKQNINGGMPYISIDETASVEQGKAVYKHATAYENRYEAFTRLDASIGYRFQGKHATHQLTIDVQNVLDEQNIFREYYDAGARAIQQEYQMGRFPTVSYKMLF